MQTYRARITQRSTHMHPQLASRNRGASVSSWQSCHVVQQRKHRHVSQLIKARAWGCATTTVAAPRQHATQGWVLHTRKTSTHREAWLSAH